MQLNSLFVSIKGTVKLENTSKLPVDSLKITIDEESVGELCIFFLES